MQYACNAVHANSRTDLGVDVVLLQAGRLQREERDRLLPDPELRRDRLLGRAGDVGGLVIGPPRVERLQQPGWVGGRRGQTGVGGGTEQAVGVNDTGGVYGCSGRVL
jgi:hypothetical protein